MKTIPLRVVSFKDWKPVSDKIENLSEVMVFMLLQSKNKQPGGYYANGHLLHYYKVDGFDYDKALKEVRL